MATVVAVSGSAPRGPGTLSGVDAADDASAVGLTCGGGLDVLITPARRQDLVRCDLPCTRRPDRYRGARGTTGRLCGTPVTLLVAPAA
ncbi:hypothetical protein [Streptomyces sp. NPDC048272]|uniref:hypothetical protein n=1 Tax=Streptomyces sp. NPDC048272 TaxID=3154616 RepID=UPI00342F5D32